MRDGSRCKSYKTPQCGHNVTRSSALVQDSTESLTQAPAPTITQSQIDVTTYVPVLQTEALQQTSAQSQAQSQAQSSTHNFKSHVHIQSHPQPLIHTESLVLAKGDGHSCPQSQVMVQVMPRTLTQELVYSHPQVLLQTHVNTQSEVHSPSQIQSHVHAHSQTHTNCHVLTQVHTQAQENTHMPNLPPVCTHLQTNDQAPQPPPPSSPSQAQSQIQRYSHSQSQALTQLPTSQLLTQSQIHSQPQAQSQTHIHMQPQVHTHTQVHTQHHAPIEPHMHSNSQPQTLPIPSIDTHIHAQPQLEPLSIQAQLPALSQASLSTTLPELVVTTQIDKSPQKNTEGLEVIHTPISRQHSSPAVSPQNLHTSSVTINDVLGSSSHTQLMHTLTAFPLTDQLNSSITLQQNGASLSQALAQPPTQSQIMDSLSVERVLMPSRSSLGHTVITQEPPVEISGLSTLHGQENFTSCSEQPSSSVKESEASKPISSSQLSSSQINSQHLGEPQLTSLHLLQGNSGGVHPLPGKTSCVTTTTSTLIASNRMLNKLLDIVKPHIPSQVTKAAEIAQLVPNLTGRLPLNSSTHAGELIHGAEVAFTSSRCGSSSYTTFTRSSMASMCTVTSSTRGSGGELGCKTSPTLSADTIYSLSPAFPTHSSTLVQPSASHRQVDVLQQVMLTPQRTSSIGEQLEGLSSESLRLLPPTPNVRRTSPVTSCSASTASSLASILPSDKIIRKTVPSNCQPCSVPKSFGISGLQGLNNGPALLEPNSRFQGSSCSKTSLITSSDPMFTSVAVTSGCSSPPSLGTVMPVKLGTIAHEELEKLKALSSDTMTSHQTLVDLLSRGSASDGVVDSNCGTNTSLTGLTDSRPPHTSDVLLSELHRTDENDLSLGATLSTTTGEELHNASNLAAEASLVAGMEGDSAPMQELPSPPLSSFSLPNITGDFMVNEVSGSKHCHTSQTQLPALLSNLPTADLDRFLDNSNTCMCIDIGLSDSEVSLNAESSFTYSPGKSHTHRKSLTATGSELTFTSALKAATTKPSSEEIKPHSDSETASNFLNHENPLLQESVKFPSARTNSLLVNMDISSNQVDFHPLKGKTVDTPKSSNQTQIKSSQSQRGKRKEVFKRNELLVQVACFKCRLCSFLSQDKGEMVNHMKELHSQYYSDTEESEEDIGQRAPKKIKVLLPQSEGKKSGNLGRSYEIKKSIRANRQCSQKRQKPCQESFNKGKSHMVKGESKQVEGKMGVHIKSEPREVGEFEGSLIGEDDNEAEEEEEENGEQEEEEEEEEEEKEEEKKEDAELIIKIGESENKIGGSEQEYVQGDDTNDSSTTSVSTTITTKASRTQSSLTPNSRNSTFTKKKNVKKSSDDNTSIRCDVNGCGLRMKSESNIIYHRKCHVNSMLQCQECLSTKFQSWRDLALHLWRHHLIDMELHKCDKCDYKSYSYSKLMNVHHKIHSDERPSLCDICGKRFKTPKQLRNHKTLHMKKTEAPQHQCEICHRPFSDKRMLRNHQESVHKKVKPFLCNYCGYSTASRSTLKMHMRQHTGEKPFACEKCKYRTSDHNSLRRHKMQHSGVRPYRCPYCDYASIQSTTFKVHLKDKHPGLAQIDGIMFTCGVCSFKTVKRDNFLAHVAEHSRGDGKKQRQTPSPAQASKTEEPQGIYGDLTPSVPHVVNIDVDSGTVTVESPQDTDFLSSVRVQAPVPGQMIMAGDKYVYATVDSSVLSQVRSGERMMQLSQDVVGVPLSLPVETSTCSPLQGLVYVTTTTSQGGQ